MHKSFILGHRVPILFTCGLLGLAAGILAASATDSLPSLMRLAACCPVSIVLLLPVLPFLIAAWAVSIEQWNILWVTVFLRYFAWGFLAAGCLRCFGTAAWLVQPMLQFTDNLSLVLFSLYCFSLRAREKRLLAAAVTGTVLAAIIDCSVISPFLVSLLSF